MIAWTQAAKLVPRDARLSSDFVSKSGQAFERQRISRYLAPRTLATICGFDCDHHHFGQHSARRLAYRPPDLGTALPLVVYAVFLTFLGASYSYRLCLVVVVAVMVPIVSNDGEAKWDAVRNALFVTVGGLAIAWAHRQQRLRLQQRARIRRKLVGRVKSRARELQQTGPNCDWRSSDRKRRIEHCWNICLCTCSRKI